MIGNSIWEMVYTKIIFKKLYVGDVHKGVLSGEREKFKENCPEEIKNIIQKCWRHNYKERPTFQEVS